MNKYLSLAGLLVILGLCVSCSEEPKPAKIELSGTAAPKVDSSSESKYPKEIREEVWGDKATFSTPRILFKARLDSDPGRYYLWSMRLDGSDRRRVAAPEMFFNAAIVHKPSRSPDNRYIALSLGKSGFFRAIIDLKEKKSIRVVDGGGYPYFNWTADSKNLIFYSDTRHYNYHLPTGKLTERPSIPSYGTFLLPRDKTFLAMQSDGFWIHDFNGKVLKKYKFNLPETWTIKDPFVSPGGELIAFKTEGSANVMIHWASVKTGKILGSEETGSFLGGSYTPIFTHNDDTFYMELGDIARYINLNTKERRDVDMKEVYIWEMYGMGQFSFMDATTKDK